MTTNNTDFPIEEVRTLAAAVAGHLRGCVPTGFSIQHDGCAVLVSRDERLDGGHWANVTMVAVFEPATNGKKVVVVGYGGSDSGPTSELFRLPIETDTAELGMDLEPHMFGAVRRMELHAACERIKALGLRQLRAVVELLHTMTEEE
jgi:hypothetical protein